MELVFLGTGPNEPVERDSRTRSSVWVKTKQTSFLIDCTPDFLEQSEREDIDRIDFILFTHAHEDCIGGIPQLKEWMDKKDYEGPMTVFMERATAKHIRGKYSRLSHLDIRYFSPYVDFEVNNIEIQPFRVKHSIQEGFPTSGFRFLDIVYSEDVGKIPEKSAKYYKNANIVVFDAAMWFGENIKGHKNVEQALQFAKEIKPDRFILMQAGHTYPPQSEAESKIQDRWAELGVKGTKVILAYDGMRLKLAEHTQQLLKEAREAIYLTKPHGRQIYTGDQELIIQPTLFRDEIGKVLYLLSDNICYGLIKLKRPDKINLKEFNELQPKHKISTEERKKWWPRKERFYAYGFDVIKMFDVPRKVMNLNRKPMQTFIHEFEFYEDEMIKDIQQYDPESLDTDVLRDDWRIVMAWWSTLRRGGDPGHSKEDIIHLARLIYKELKKRGTEFHPEKMKKYSKELFDLVTGKKKELSEPDLSDPNLLKDFNDKTIIKDFISVVGSVAEGNPKPNDMDLLIRMNEPPDYLRRAIEVRILKDLDWSNKVQFIWGDAEGPHDTYIPLYDLVLQKNKPLKKVTMSAQEIKLSISSPFKPMKPSKRFYRVDKAIEYMFEHGSKFAIEKKYNGFRAVLIKSGNTVRIYSDQEENISKKFPTILSEAKKLTNKDIVLDTELVHETAGRSKLIKYVVGDEEVDDTKVTLYAFDCLYYDDEELYSKPWEERKKVLHRLDFTNHIQEVHSIIVDSKTKARKAIKLVRNMKGSEGAMIKQYRGKYKKGGESNAWIKFRNTDTIIVKVIDKRKTENGHVYTVGIPIDNPEKFKSSYVKDGILVLGNTFVTKHSFDTGDKIAVNIEEVWRHKWKDDTIRYSIHKPQVLKGSSKKYTGWQDLDELAVSKGEEVIENIGETTTGTAGIGDIAGKKWKKKPIKAPKKLEDMTEEDLQGSEGGEHMVKNFPDRMQKSFKSVIGEWHPFVIQWHLRGTDSIHTDLRMKVNDHLEGFTLFTPSSMDGEDELDNNPENIRGTIKLPQPPEWLDAEGGYPPGSPGSTKKHGAYFAIIAKGEYRPLEVEDHKITFELRTDKGSVKKMKPIDESDEEHVKEFNKKLPSKLKQLDGCYSYHIAHIEEDRWIILFDKLSECPEPQEQENKEEKEKKKPKKKPRTIPYADPGYQEDGKKRYPLGSKAQVRSALGNINKKENQEQYTPEQLEKIMDKIYDAAKKYGIVKREGFE